MNRPQAPHDRRVDAARRNVIVADPMHALGMDRLSANFNTSYLFAYDVGKERNVALETSDALVVRVFKTTEELMDQMPRLKLIVNHGSGVDNIDIAAASKRGILVASTPGGANAIAAAEGAVSLMLAILRRTPEMDDCVRENRFAERSTLQLRDLWGKTLGLVGFGQIARVAARIGGAGFNKRLCLAEPARQRLSTPISGSPGEHEMPTLHKPERRSRFRWRGKWTAFALNVFDEETPTIVNFV